MMQLHWQERDLSSLSVREYELTSLEGEYMRVSSDDETVAISWSTNVSVAGLISAIANRNTPPSQWDAILVGTTGAKEYVPASVALEEHIVDEWSNVSVQIPLEHFSVSWLGAERPDHPPRKFAAAAISYARGSTVALNEGIFLLQTTGTPLVRCSEQTVRGVLRDFKAI